MTNSPLLYGVLTSPGFSEPAFLRCRNVRGVRYYRGMSGPGGYGFEAVYMFI